MNSNRLGRAKPMNSSSPSLYDHRQYDVVTRFGFSPWVATTDSFFVPLSNLVRFLVGLFCIGFAFSHVCSCSSITLSQSNVGREMKTLSIRFIPMRKRE
ncbi:hypothetical protein P8452_17289 [Trifolium repens]|nr:hypothetical protein P8452_17289 [Trifolium repens]